MSEENVAVAVFGSHAQAQSAIKSLGETTFPFK